MKHYKHPKRYFKHLISSPFIYALIFPAVTLDFFVTVYYKVCFPLYKLEKVKRQDYFIFDREKLTYLRWKDKLDCVYCSYVNGLFAYASKIGAETEKYWCGIKHQRVRVRALQENQKDYLEYGDKKAFEKFTEQRD